MKKYYFFAANIIMFFCVLFFLALYIYIWATRDSLLITIASIIIVVASLFYFVKVKKDRNNQKTLSIQKARIQQNYDQLSSEYDKLNSSHNELKSRYQILSAERIELERSKERLQSLFEYSQEALWEYDYTEEKWYLSNRIIEMYNLESKWAESKSNIILEKLIHPDDKYYLLRLFSQVKNGKMKKFCVECRAFVNNEYRWTRIRGTVFLDKYGNMARITGSYTDIQNEKTKEEKILELAYADSVTGLPNRLWLSYYLESLVKSEDPFILMYMDLDNFKIINDIFGYIYGDSILKKMGIRLKAYSGKGSVVCRISGDTFAILLTDKDKVNAFDSFINKLKEQLSEPIRVDENEFHFTFSMGFAVFPEDGQTGDDLMKNADTAMLKAKSTGKNLLKRFEKRMNDELYEKVLLEREIRKALENSELYLFYQPQISLNDNSIIGLEALIRWFHPERGLIKPLEFIPLAEEVGLINRVGEWVFSTACNFSAKINKSRIEPIYVSVNVSPVQLMQHDFLNRFVDILNETGVNPEWMVIEITESALMESNGENVLKLKEIKKKGIRIALDDFGTGYSSMHYLQGLPVDIMKIDRTFIKDISKPGNDRKLTEAMIILAHRLGMNVIAEGVEKIEQLKVLKKYGCDVAQGFYLSKPVSGNKILKIINESNCIVPAHIYEKVYKNV